MTTIERTVSIRSAPDEVYRYISDVSHLPDFIDMLTAVRPGDSGGAVHVVAEVPGRGTEEGDATFRADGATRRVEWGSPSNPDYAGWMQVDDGAEGSATVRLGMLLHHDDQRGEQSIDKSLETLRDRLEG
jgi:uncharacterized membrane protein